MSWQEGWQAIVDRVLPKCNTKLNHGDKVLGKIEKNSFIALLGKGGGHSRLGPSKLCPILKGMVRGLRVFEEQDVISTWTKDILLIGWW